jgi:hypothetical protein
MMNIVINSDGLIVGIGDYDDSVPAPLFINYDNAWNLKCMDLTNIEDENNWVEIGEFYEED